MQMTMCLYKYQSNETMEMQVTMCEPKIYCEES